MGKITIEVKINTFGNMLYSLNYPIGRYVVRKSTVKVKISKLSLIGKIFGKEVMLEMPR